MGVRSDGKERLAGHAVQHEQIALLGGLGDGVNRLAVMHHRQQHGRRWEIAILDVVMDALEMP